MATESVMKLTLVDLPPEILIRILLLLPSPSIFACAKVNRYFLDLIADSVEVQYHILCNISGKLDNPSSKIPIYDRLVELLVRERRWEEFSLDVERTIDIPFPSSGIYDLTGGIYLLGSVSRRVLHYFYLPSEPGEEIEWRDLRLPHTIIDMGLCVEEHDLMAVITTYVVVCTTTCSSFD